MRFRTHYATIWKYFRMYWTCGQRSGQWKRRFEQALGQVWKVSIDRTTIRKRSPYVKTYVLYYVRNDRVNPAIIIKTSVYRTDEWFIENMEKRSRFFKENLQSQAPKHYIEINNCVSREYLITWIDRSLCFLQANKQNWAPVICSCVNVNSFLFWQCQWLFIPYGQHSLFIATLLFLHN